MADQTNVLEFNSNTAVLLRCSKIIDAINDTRFKTTRKDEFGEPFAEAEEYLSHIISLYMEVSVEMDEDEDKIWDELVELRDQLRMNPPRPTVEKMAYWRTTISSIDDLNRKMRKLAKEHGFLASNKPSSKGGGLR